MSPDGIQISVRPSRRGEFNEPDLNRPVTAALCLIASDLTTETKVEIPKDASLYWSNVDAVAPEDFLRASMSIPFFFTPYVISPANNIQGDEGRKAAATAWADRVGAEPGDLPDGWLPERCLLVDGSVMSNFPIDAFHDVCPTVGIKLQVDKHQTMIDSPITLAFGLFDAARHCRDNDFITKNPDFRWLVEDIDTGDVSWINFNLPDEQKLQLFKAGVRAAIDWLDRFDWQAYKKVRQGVLAAHFAARATELFKAAGPAAAQTIPSEDGLATQGP